MLVHGLLLQPFLIDLKVVNVLFHLLLHRAMNPKCEMVVIILIEKKIDSIELDFVFVNKENKSPHRYLQTWATKESSACITKELVNLNHYLFFMHA